MHPPAFNPNNLLSDWPECFLHVYCRCGRSTHSPVKLLIWEVGDHAFKAVLSRLHCKLCGGPPAPVYLCAGHHRTAFAGGMGGLDGGTGGRSEIGAALALHSKKARPSRE